MENSLIITIIIAVIGWILAFINIYKNRQWQKKDILANRKYETYNRFLTKLDAISYNMRKSPQKIIGETLGNFLISIQKEDADINEELIKFNREISKFLQSSIEPIYIIKNELASLRLTASPDLQIKIDKLNLLSEDLYNDFQNCLSNISLKGPNNYKPLETIGNDTRWLLYSKLYEDIITQMKDEIQIH